MGRTEGRSVQDTKDLILHAAVNIIRRDGLSATLDDIALEAGVSKGGLVYHYRSKQALLLALGEWIAEAFVAQVHEHRDPSDSSPGALTRAYWQGQIWSLARDSEGWRAYNGGGMHDPADVTGGHYDHLHITVKEGA